VVACTPHPGFGTVSLRQGALVRVVDLGTCRSHATRFRVPTLPVTVAATPSEQRIVFRGRTVYRVHEDRSRIPGGSPGPIELFGLMPDRQWILFAIDPQGSASLAADGLTLQAVSVHGGPAHVVSAGLLGEDYRTWCGGRLVLTAGGDRIAAHHKWLVVTGPPAWRTRTLLRIPGRAFGSLTCDHGAVVVETTRDLGPNMNIHPHWSLWRVQLDGRATPLATPPRGASDESPRAGRNGGLLYVRTDGVRGTLYAFGLGPLLQLGAAQSFYGAYDWWQSMSWSLAPSR
jgi:hypothetical protein